jgi:hypothetical protein
MDSVVKQGKTATFFTPEDAARCHDGDKRAHPMLRDHAIHRLSAPPKAENNGQCDDGEFKLDAVAVADEAAVERKDVRRVRPLLSELQVLEWQELGKTGRSGEKC